MKNNNGFLIQGERLKNDILKRDSLLNATIKFGYTNPDSLKKAFNAGKMQKKKFNKGMEAYGLNRNDYIITEEGSSPAPKESEPPKEDSGDALASIYRVLVSIDKTLFALNTTLKGIDGKTTANGAQLYNIMQAVTDIKKELM